MQGIFSVAGRLLVAHRVYSHHQGRRLELVEAALDVMRDDEVQPALPSDRSAHLFATWDAYAEVSIGSVRGFNGVIWGV
jgi:hypothetical protein